MGKKSTMEDFFNIVKFLIAYIPQVEYNKKKRGRYPMLKHGILGLLNYRDMTGYEIMEVFRDSLSFFWNAQTSQIYRELQSLEKKSWVCSRVVPQQGKPDKKLYTITEEGRAELIQWLADGDPGLSPRTPLLMKVFFLGERSREENICYFQQLKAACEMFLASLEPIPESIEAYSHYLDAPDKAAYWQMTVEYGRRNMKMHMEWAQSCIERLEGME